MRIRIAMAVLLVMAMVAVFFVDIPRTAQAQTPGLPTGPWVDRLIWSEQPNSGLALEQIKTGGGDFFMFTLQGGSEKTESFLSPDVLSFSTFGSVNALLFNPQIQVGENVPGQQAMNPFQDNQFREAMQWLFDRNFLNLNVQDGFAVSFVVPFHPKEADYFREIELFQALEGQYAGDFARAVTQINQRMAAMGATRIAGTCSQTTGANCWVDSQGDIIDIKIAARIEDERLQIGQYAGQQLGRAGFKVSVNPVPSSQAIPMVYGGDPAIGAWHIYTEGWAFTSAPAWDDGQLYYFANCGIGEPFCSYYGGSYTPPADLAADTEALIFGQYTSLAQRQQLIRSVTPRTFTEANYRMWIQAEQAVFPVSKNVEGVVMDAFGGPWSTFTLKSAKLVPGAPGVDATTGVGGDVRVLNYIMFADAWNPWRGNWLYDSIQRGAFGDPGMTYDPNTGLFIDYRVNVTAQTAGPTGTMPVPSSALAWNSTQGKFVTLASEGVTGLTAVSKVTTKLTNPGKWHTGQDISMDDAIYGLATSFRRAYGDVYGHDTRCSNSISGLRFSLANATYPLANNPSTQGVFKGFEFNLATNEITAYLDSWHVDPQEIKGAGSIYMSDEEIPAPWEIQEAILKTVINDQTACHEATATAKGVPRLDLARDPTTLAFIGGAFSALKTQNYIPPFMLGLPGIGDVITSAEATARYQASQDFRNDFGHWYASNGPFMLESINPVFRQSVMVAFRDGYPFTPDHWDYLKVKRVPAATFGTFPTSLLAGTSANLALTTTEAGDPADPKGVRWFVRQLDTKAIPVRGDAVRTAVGQFEIQLLSTQTVGLQTGGFELVVVIQGEQGSLTQTFAFSVTSQLDFFSALFNEVSNRLTGTQEQITDLRDDVANVQGAASGLQSLVTAVLVLAVVAILVPAAMLTLILRRLPGAKPSMPAPEEMQEPPEGT